MNILIIEDSELLMQIIIQSIDKTYDSQVKGLKYLNEIEKELKKSKYDIIILNSKVNANENNKLINLVRKADKFIYILVISSETNLNYIKNFYEAGIDYFIPIPFDPEMFNLLLQRIYERINQFSCTYKGVEWIIWFLF